MIRLWCGGVPHREHSRHALHHPEWIDSGRKTSQKYKQSVFFTALNAMYAKQDQEEVQYDLDTARIAVYKNTWRVHQKYGILVQFETRSEKRIGVLSNTIPRDRFFEHITCDMHRESGIHEDWRGFILQSKTIPKDTASRTHAEFASRMSGSI